MDDDKKTKNDSVNVGVESKEYISVAEEKIFRKFFARPKSFYDSDVVTIQDIKNLVLFTLKSGATQKFIDFLHRDTFDDFLHAAIFYMELYLRVLDILKTRREKETAGMIRGMHSFKYEQLLSQQLSDRRSLMAREYSKVEISKTFHIDTL